MNSFDNVIAKVSKNDGFIVDLSRHKAKGERYKVHMVACGKSYPLNDPSTETLCEAIGIAKEHMEIRKTIAADKENDDVYFEIVVLPF